MRRKLVAGNWKMHGTQASADALVRAVVAGLPQGVDVAVFPPAVQAATLVATLAGSPIKVGVQDVSEHAQGAYTGEVAAAMARDIGCTHTLVGHSERRQYHAESNERVAAKFAQAQAAGLIPVLCVGETLAEREGEQTQAVVAAQIEAVRARCGIGAFAQAVVAYEPVWAIGTGKTATDADVQAMHGFIRAELVRLLGEAGRGILILYGGSVRPANAASLLAVPEVGGALVGGAALKADDFLSIARAAKAG